MACLYDGWRWVKRATGEVRPYFCDSWRCKAHQGRVQRHWAGLVAAWGPQRMITLTNVPKNRARASLAWSHLVQQVRRDFGSFSYAKFLEAGSKTGMLHWHVAQRGTYIPKWWLTRHAEAVGLGRIVDLRRCYGQGPAWYMAKYITKDSGPTGFRKVTTSLDFPRPEIPEGETGWQLIKAGEHPAPKISLAQHAIWYQGALVHDDVVDRLRIRYSME